jgi:KilA-N domain
MAKQTIKVEGIEIRLLTEEKSNFISLTDLTQNFEGGAGLIEKWLRNRNTIEFLGMWEKIYNPKFNETAFKEIGNKAGLNSFMLSVKRWIEQTGAVGIEAKSGRYGGTYAHKDIALEFCT